MSRGECAAASPSRRYADPRGSVLFVEHGTHKTIYPGYPWGTGSIRVSDQAIIDALREAFEKAGVEVEDAVG